MNRVFALNQRYIDSDILVRHGVELVAVGDAPGARFDTATRRLIRLVNNQGEMLLGDLVQAAKALRWRRITRPQPSTTNPEFHTLATEVAQLARRFSRAVEDQALLEELASSAMDLVTTDSPVGSILMESIEEVGVDACVVIGATRSAAIDLSTWLLSKGVLVRTLGDLRKCHVPREQAYVIGPPRFYPSSLVTAPVTESLTYLLPSWFTDHSVPESAIAPYAEGAIHIHKRVFKEGEPSEPIVTETENIEGGDEYHPMPTWRVRPRHDREPSKDEVKARKLLLSGDLAMWLDDGERIRSLDPDQPKGERLNYADVRAVRAGTYLVLRQGETESSLLYRASISRLQHGDDVAHMQNAWKHSLAEQLRSLGYRQVVRKLTNAGVKASEQAQAWTDPTLIRPSRDQDFERLLRWLNIPLQPTFSYANELRRMVYQVSAEIRRQLEAAVAKADLSELDAVGHLELNAETVGYRAMLATRVLAVSPFLEVVSRSDARVPFEDRSGRWLE